MTVQLLLGIALAMLGLAAIAAFADLANRIITRPGNGKLARKVVDALIKHGKDATE